MNMSSFDLYLSATAMVLDIKHDAAKAIVTVLAINAKQQLFKIKLILTSSEILIEKLKINDLVLVEGFIVINMGEVFPIPNGTIALLENVILEMDSPSIRILKLQDGNL